MPQSRLNFHLPFTVQVHLCIKAVRSCSEWVGLMDSTSQDVIPECVESGVQASSLHFFVKTWNTWFFWRFLKCGCVDVRMEWQHSLSFCHLKYYVWSKIKLTQCAGMAGSVNCLMNSGKQLANPPWYKVGLHLVIPCGWIIILFNVLTLWQWQLCVRIMGVLQELITLIIIIHPWYVL